MPISQINKPKTLKKRKRSIMPIPRRKIKHKTEKMISYAKKKKEMGFQD